MMPSAMAVRTYHGSVTDMIGAAILEPYHMVNLQIRPSILSFEQRTAATGILARTRRSPQSRLAHNYGSFELPSFNHILFRRLGRGR